MHIFCLIPAYNEKGNLVLLSQKLLKALRKEKVTYTLFYVLQGKDAGVNEIKELQKKNRNIRYVFFEKPLGIGKAYQVGFENMDSRASHVFTLDADLNHDPKYLPQFISSMDENNADVVIGSRYMSGGQFLDNRRWKRVISLAMNKFITTILEIPVHDISSGFRLIKRDVILKVKPKLRERNYPSYMEFIINAHKQKFRLFETSIIYTPRTWGKSKMNSMKTLKDYVLFLPKVAAFIF